MEMQKSDIERAIKKTKALLCQKQHFTEISANGENEFSVFYAATNDNLDYLANLHVEGKDALTVTGSGDHALNLAYFGAKSIENFDINELANIALDLKITALLHLTKNEFIDFYSEPNFLDRSIYQKIYPYLNDVTKAVFDTLFEYIKSDYEFATRCVTEQHLASINLVRNNPYLSSEQAYLETQRRLRNIETLPTSKVCPVHKIDKMFAPKDIILLSNVLGYCKRQDYAASEYNFYSQADVDSLMRTIKNTLKEDGLVSLLFMLYGYGVDEKTIRDYYNVKGHLEKVYYKEDFDTGYSQVFLAKKEDFPEFER